MTGDYFWNVPAGKGSCSNIRRQHDGSIVRGSTGGTFAATGCESATMVVSKDGERTVLCWKLEGCKGEIAMSTRVQDKEAKG